MGISVAFNSLDNVVTRYNPGTEKKLFSSRIVPSGLSVAEVPYTVLHNAARLYSEQTNPHNYVDATQTRTREITFGREAS